MPLISQATLTVLLLAPPFAIAHPGQVGGATEEDHSLDSLTFDQRVTYGFLVIAFALIGTLIGSLIPPIDILLNKIHKKPLSKRNLFDKSMIYLFNGVRTYRFTSHSLGFSAGVLLYGTFSLMLPGSYNLLRITSLGTSAQMVTFALWLAGIGIIALCNYLVELFVPESHGCACQVDISRGDEDNDNIQQPPKDDTTKDAAILSIDTNETTTTTIPQNENVYSSSTIAITKVENDIDNDFARLEILGKFTACAIAIHKIPEGIVTFTSVMADPHVGILIALAFALHNAPEAISVSVPIYLSTKSATKAFLWSFFGIGIWQLVGAAIGYGLVRSVGFSPLAQGLIYAPIAGIITYIAIHGIWGAAIVYEQKNLRKAKKLNTNPGLSVQWWFIIGAAVMFLSVALFGYA